MRHCWLLAQMQTLEAAKQVRCVPLPASCPLSLPLGVFPDEAKSPVQVPSSYFSFSCDPRWNHLLMLMKNWEQRNKKGIERISKCATAQGLNQSHKLRTPWEGHHSRSATPHHNAVWHTSSELTVNPTKVFSLFWNPPTSLLFTTSGRKWQINPFFKRMSRFLVILCVAQDMIVSAA